jgi:hypothetical protein
MTRIRSSIALVVSCVWALGLGGAALAADMAMPTKAPPPPAPPPLDIHGFVEWDWESFLINPQGQALIPKSTVTVVAGLDWILYHNKAGWINKVTVGGGGATDWSDEFTGYWALFDSLSASGRSANGALFDTVMFITGSVTFGQYWTLSDTYYNVYSNDVCSSVNPGCAAAPAAIGFNVLLANELKLTFSDSFTGWWITFNPYVTWFSEFTGPTGGTGFACFTCAANGSDFFIGMVPTVSGKLWGMPWLTIKAPTYVTVGDSSFWGHGLVTGANSGSLGVFTTGLTFIAGLGQWIPANLGNWYAKAGFQYYDIINTALQEDNAFSVCGVGLFPGATCSDWKTRNIIVGFAGVGVAF